MNKIMWKVSVAVLCLLAACSEQERSTMDSKNPGNDITRATSEVSAVSGKSTPFDQFKFQLEQIRTEYLATPKISELAHIEALYVLDDRLVQVVNEASRIGVRSNRLPSYPEIGIYVRDSIYYSGKIREVADKLLPTQGFIDPKTGMRIEVKGDRYSKLKGRLEEIYQSYTTLKQTPEDAETLFELSEELYKVVGKIHEAYPGDRSQTFWDEKYVPLGLYIGHYSDQLDYGGKLIVDAHRLNPNSRYSEETLVAAISGGGDMSELSGIPDVGLAKQYLEKYPGGKHLQKVYSILATFYQNLYEELLPGEESPSITYCYKEHLEANPEDKDLETVRKKSIGYYKKILTFEQPAAEEYREALSNLENRIDGRRRYWCTD